MATIVHPRGNTGLQDILGVVGAVNSWKRMNNERAQTLRSLGLVERAKQQLGQDSLYDHEESMLDKLRGGTLGQTSEEAGKKIALDLALKGSGFSPETDQMRIDQAQAGSQNAVDIAQQLSGLSPDMAGMRINKAQELAGQPGYGDYDPMMQTEMAVQDAQRQAGFTPKAESRRIDKAARDYKVASYSKEASKLEKQKQLYANHAQRKGRNPEWERRIGEIEAKANAFKEAELKQAQDKVSREADREYAKIDALPSQFRSKDAVEKLVTDWNDPRGIHHHMQGNLYAKVMKKVGEATSLSEKFKLLKQARNLAHGGDVEGQTEYAPMYDRMLKELAGGMRGRKTKENKYTLFLEGDVAGTSFTSSKNPQDLVGMKINGKKVISADYAGTTAEPKNIQEIRKIENKIKEGMLSTQEQLDEEVVKKALQKGITKEQAYDMIENEKFNALLSNFRGAGKSVSSLAENKQEKKGKLKAKQKKEFWE